MRLRIAVTVVAAMFVGLACQDWNGAREDFCAQEGAFCFDDGGAPEEDAGGEHSDGGEEDAGEADAGATDAGELDAGELDAGVTDAGEPDAGTVDASFAIPASFEFLSSADTVDLRAVAAPLDDTYLVGGYVHSSAQAPVTFRGVSLAAPLGDDGVVAWLDAQGGVKALQLSNPTVASDERVTAVEAITTSRGYAVGTYNGGRVEASSAVYATSDAGTAGFVLAFDNNGNPVWMRDLGASGYANPRGVEEDSNGAVVLAEWTGQLNFDALTADAGSARDGIMLRLNSTGALLWSTTFTCAGADAGIQFEDVEINAGGQILAVGAVTGSCTMDPSTATTSFYGQKAGTRPEWAFYTRFNSSGAQVGTEQPYDSASGAVRSRFTSVASHDGAAVVVGDFTGRLKMGITADYPDYTVNRRSAVVLRYAGSPVPEGFLVTSTGEVFAPRVSLLDDGTPVVIGSFTGMITAGAHMVTAAGPEANVFVLHLAPDLQSVLSLSAFAPGLAEGGLPSVGHTPSHDMCVVGNHQSGFSLNGESFNSVSGVGSYFLKLTGG